MTLETKVNFFKEYIAQENNRKEKINEQFFYYIGLFSVELGFVGYYLLDLPAKQDGVWWYLFCGLGIANLLINLCLLGSIVRFLESKNGEYKYLPYPSEIKCYINAIEASTMAKCEKDEEFNEYLLESYIEISGHNTGVNEVRQSIVNKMRKILLVNILILCVAFIPYFTLMGNELNSHKVILLNDKVLIDTNSSKSFDIKVVNDKLLIDANILNDLKTKADIISNQNIKKDSDMAESNNTNSNHNKIPPDKGSSQINNTPKDKPSFDRPKVRLVHESYDPTSDDKKKKE